jgi:hypothetical protein
MLFTCKLRHCVHFLCLKLNYHYINVLEKVAINHIDIELAADFKNKKLKGLVDLNFTKIDENCDHIVWHRKYILSIK